MKWPWQWNFRKRNEPAAQPFFGGRKGPESPPKDDGKPMSLRRWEAARTNRLNAAQWKHSIGQTINQDLASHGETIIANCEYEMSINPYFAGVAKTWVDSVVGEEGPKLQVISDDEEYNTALEQCWNEQFWNNPDINGVMSGAQMLALWVHQEWPVGEFSAQIVVDKQAPTPIKTRIHTFSAKAIRTPIDKAGDPNVTLGIKHDRRGKPLIYHVETVDPDDVHFGTGIKSEEIRPENIIHGFTPTEPGQKRGVPWFASSCQTASDLRNYDFEVLVAMRTAARLSLVWENTHADAKYVNLNESSPTEAGEQWIGPPGYDCKQLQPTQPGTMYEVYKNERLLEFGRPVHMPLMMVKLDSRDHSFSSAHFDNQLFQRGVRTYRGRQLERHLNRLVDIIKREAQLLALSRHPEIDHRLAKPPAKVRFEWTWPEFPDPDPRKTAESANIRVQGLLSTLIDEWQKQGIDPDQLKSKMLRLKNIFAELELPWPPPGLFGAAPKQSVDEKDKQEVEDEAAEKPASKTEGKKRFAVHRMNGLSGVEVHV